MGGGHHDHDPNHHVHPVYQTHVWNQRIRRFMPEDPPNWKRNTAITGCFVLASIASIFYISTKYERRPHPPIRPIPSQRWSKHALDDDPDYYQKLEEYKKDPKRFKFWWT